MYKESPVAPRLRATRSTKSLYCSCGWYDFGPAKTRKLCCFPTGMYVCGCTQETAKVFRFSQRCAARRRAPTVFQSRSQCLSRVFFPHTRLRAVCNFKGSGERVRLRKVLLKSRERRRLHGFPSRWYILMCLRMQPIAAWRLYSCKSSWKGSEKLRGKEGSWLQNGGQLNLFITDRSINMEWSLERNRSL